MPVGAVAITLDTLEEQFVAQMLATTPRYQRGQDSGWKHYPRRRTPGTSLRYFRIEWDPTGYVENGIFTHQIFEAGATCSIFVDYGGVPHQVVKKMATADHYQLRDRFNLLKNTDGAAGLRTVKAIDWDFAVENNGDQAQIIHQYEVTYLEARS